MGLDGWNVKDRECPVPDGDALLWPAKARFVATDARMVRSALAFAGSLDDSGDHKQGSPHPRGAKEY